MQDMEVYVHVGSAKDTGDAPHNFPVEARIFMFRSWVFMMEHDGVFNILIS